MGVDFSNHQVFAADNPKQLRIQLISKVHTYMTECGYIEVAKREAADRSIAVGPHSRWICLYDSISSGDDSDLKKFEDLTLYVSRDVPVVDIHMMDSAALSMIFYQNGKKVDHVADSLDIVQTWGSYEERGIYQGYPESWADVLSDPRQADLLRQAWQEHNSDKMLSETATLLSWNPDLCEVGYTIDWDGVPEYYRDCLRHRRVDTSAFSEYHFSLTV